MVSDFLKVVCANGRAKTVFEVATLKKSLLLRCLLFVVDFVSLGGTNSVLVT